VDTQKPSAPAGLTATATHGEVDLTWTASTDNAAVARYTVLRDWRRTVRVIDRRAYHG